MTMDTFLFSKLSAIPLSIESLSILMALLSCGILLLCLRFGGAYGLISFMTMAYLACNIQVLHLAQFSFLSEPVALGTWLFAMTYLASDMLTEHYGAAHARRAVVLSFVTQIGFTALMIVCIWHPPLSNVPGNGEIHASLTHIFMPSVRIMIASVIAYACSQFLDIWIFQKIANMTQGRYVWLRTTASSALAALLDNIIFSSLAWVILSPHPVSWHTLIYTYILGTYGARFCVSLIGIPMMYVSYKIKPEAHQKSVLDS